MSTTGRCVVLLGTGLFLLVGCAGCADSTASPGSFAGDGGAGGSSAGAGSGRASGSGVGSGASGASTGSGASGAGATAGSDDAGVDASGTSTGSGSGSSTPPSSGAGTAGSSGSSGSGGTSGSQSGSTSGAGGGSTDDASDGSKTPPTQCTNGNATCMASNTGCNVGSYYLYDNQWNCGGNTGNHCGAESAYGCANGDGTVSWVVTSNQPAGNTAVLTYPAMQDNFDSKPLLSSFKSITATFTETSPHVGDYEVAWDCWFDDNANELMIWVDNYNQTPGGNKVGSMVSLGGRSYDVWWSPSSGTGGYLAFVANQTFTSGTVDLLQIFDYSVAHNWLPSTAKVNQLSFGVEVCSTNGKDARWTVSDYSLTAN